MIGAAQNELEATLEKPVQLEIVIQRVIRIEN
jgi:hypothetical protein